MKKKSQELKEFEVDFRRRMNEYVEQMEVDPVWMANVLEKVHAILREQEELRKQNGGKDPEPEEEEIVDCYCMTDYERPKK